MKSMKADNIEEEKEGRKKKKTNCFLCCSLDLTTREEEEEKENGQRRIQKWVKCPQVMSALTPIGPLGKWVPSFLINFWQKV